MGTKQNPGPFDCLKNALDDEPFFLVLARDEAAPALVRGWASGRLLQIEMGIKPESDRAMVDEALACADAMEKWRAENYGKWRQPEASA